MRKIAVTIHLPEDIARRAEEADLLNDESMAAILENELGKMRPKKRSASFDAIVDKLESLDVDLLSTQEIAREIAGTRSQSARRSPLDLMNDMADSEDDPEGKSPQSE